MGSQCIRANVYGLDHLIKFRFSFSVNISCAHPRAIHRFEDGGCIGRFPLATNETYLNKQTNEKVSNTEWHNIVLRNKAAEICEKYLSKGDKVYIEGRIKTRKWQDDKGNDRYSTEINCTEFTFLSNKNEDVVSSNENVNQKPEIQQPKADVVDIDDDLPF